MTEDELLEQIRTVDPDARVEQRGGFRIIVTTAIAPNNVAFINPANMEIFPFEMDFGVAAGPEPKVVWSGELYEGPKREGRLLDGFD